MISAVVDAETPASHRIDVKKKTVTSNTPNLKPNECQRQQQLTAVALKTGAVYGSLRKPVLHRKIRRYVETRAYNHEHECNDRRELHNCCSEIRGPGQKWIEIAGYVRTTIS